MMMIMNMMMMIVTEYAMVFYLHMLLERTVNVTIGELTD